MTKPSRNVIRSRLTLSNLYLVLALCALILGVGYGMGPEFALGFSGFVFSFAFVLLMMLAVERFDRLLPDVTRATAFFRVPLFYCGLQLSFFMFGVAIDQRHPDYVVGHWITVALTHFLPIFSVIGGLALVVVTIDVASQKPNPSSLVYYPQMAGLRSALKRFDIRLLAVISSMLIFCYYTTTVINVWREQQGPSTVWPPARVAITCGLFWGTFWIADCLNRPKQSTLIAAIVYVGIHLMLLQTLGANIIRE